MLTSPLPRDEVVHGVAAACASDLGFAKAIHALSREAWAALVAGDPYPEAEPAPTTLHAAVPAAEPDPVRVADLRARVAARSGAGSPASTRRHDSLPVQARGGGSTRGIGVANAARTWNTVTRLLDMGDAADRADRA